MFTMVFVVFQSILLLLLAVHDWVDLFPFNDVRALRQKHSFKFLVITTVINCLTVGGTLAGTIYFRNSTFPLWFKIQLMITYSLFLTGMFWHWYRPMIWNVSQAEKEDFTQEYAHTHHIIPDKNDEIRPNTLHLIIHFFIVASALLAFSKVLHLF